MEFFFFLFTIKFDDAEFDHDLEDGSSSIEWVYVVLALQDWLLSFKDIV